MVSLRISLARILDSIASGKEQNVGSVGSKICGIAGISGFLGTDYALFSPHIHTTIHRQPDSSVCSTEEGSILTHPCCDILADRRQYCIVRRAGRLIVAWMLKAFLAQDVGVSTKLSAPAARERLHLISSSSSAAERRSCSRWRFWSGDSWMAVATDSLKTLGLSCSAASIRATTARFRVCTSRVSACLCRQPLVALSRIVKVHLKSG